jgi:hypothetical protein
LDAPLGKNRVAGERKEQSDHAKKIPAGGQIRHADG